MLLSKESRHTCERKACVRKRIRMCMQSLRITTPDSFYLLSLCFVLVNFEILGLLSYQ